METEPDRSDFNREWAEWAVKKIEQLRGSWDALAVQQQFNEQVTRENHELRGLLETAVDAWDSGQWNSLLSMQICGLPVAWREKTKEVLK